MNRDYYFYEKIKENYDVLDTLVGNVDIPAQSFYRNNLSESEDYIKNLSLIDFFLKAVHSATRLGDQIKAQAYYEQAKELLKQYQDCKNCY